MDLYKDTPPLELTKLVEKNPTNTYLKSLLTSKEYWNHRLNIDYEIKEPVTGSSTSYDYYILLLQKQFSKAFTLAIKEEENDLAYDLFTKYEINLLNSYEAIILTVNRGDIRLLELLNPIQWSKILYSYKTMHDLVFAAMNSKTIRPLEYIIKNDSRKYLEYSTTYIEALLYALIHSKFAAIHLLLDNIPFLQETLIDIALIIITSASLKNYNSYYTLVTHLGIEGIEINLEEALDKQLEKPFIILMGLTPILNNKKLYIKWLTEAIRSPYLQSAALTTINRYKGLVQLTNKDILGLIEVADQSESLIIKDALIKLMNKRR